MQSCCYVCLHTPLMTYTQVRIIFGTVATAAYNELNLYNLYVQAFKKAGFASKIKAHLPRHIMGYRQVRMGWVIHKFQISY